MEGDVRAFLESGKLEAYIYGSLDEKDRAEVMRYIDQYPEVRQEYLALQDQLEKLSVEQSKKLPTAMKAQIMEALPDKEVSETYSRTNWSRYISVVGIAASLILAMAWYNSNSKLEEARAQYSELQEDCEQRSEELEKQNAQIAYFKSPETQKFELTGKQPGPIF